MLAQNGKTIRILIVDDQELIRAGLKVALEQGEGLEVVGEATDGQSAVRQTLSSVPDVVLMDLAMPVMDGIDATKEIKTALSNTRVIVLTSHDSDQDVFAALGAGADGYCLKDVSREQLSLAVKTVASGATWLDPQIAGRVLRAYSTTKTSDSQTAAPTGSLSPREMEVLQLLVDGLSNQQMAVRLVVSVETIKTHMRHIMEKLSVSDRTQAAIKAMKDGLVTPA